MGPRSAEPMTLSVAFRLGRVSNLPTVWTNVIAGIALAGGSTWDLRIIPLLLAVSLFYTAGMFLNDAFDWKIDSEERTDRPIPRQEVTTKTVFTAGGLMLCVGLLILIGIGYWTPTGTRHWPVLAGLILCGLIVLYDWHHKNNPFSPLIMGGCRMMVYITAALAISVHPSGEVLWGGLVLLCWIIGLTYIAKQELLGNFASLWPIGFLAVPFLYCFPYVLESDLAAAIWIGLFVVTVFVLYLLKRRHPGDIGLGVVTLIAGISLLDALFVLRWGDQGAGFLALAAFALTLVLQRIVPGT